MPSKVILKVIKGEFKGKEFIYDSKEQLFIGRQEDCSIVLPDKTVSRYHCMLEITPPDVTVRDFGSLNGTFLNGEKIGQRERSISAEDAQKEYHEEFELHDGDTLGLSRNCEIRLQTVSVKRCAECREELPDCLDAGDGGTVLDDAPINFINEKGEAICKECFLKNEAKKKEAELDALEKERKEREKAEAERIEKARLEQERLEKERAEAEKKRKEAEAVAMELAKKLKEAADKAAKDEAERKRMEAEQQAGALRKAEEEKQRKLEEQRKAEEERKKKEAEEQRRREAEQMRLEEIKKQQAGAQRKCSGCGVLFTPKTPDNNLCPRCIQNMDIVLDAILMQMLGGAAVQPQKNMGPAAIKGFHKVKKLGAGGMGEVWLVQEEKTGKKYALKTMLPQAAADKNSKETFLREAMLGEVLDHKNIIKVYKTGCESGVFFILMELCEGGSVDKYMERCGGKLPLDVATYIILQVLDGLEYAHHANVSVKCGWRTKDAVGVVHRDFKPGNIFLSDNNRYPMAKVADFGLAKAFETAGLSKHTRTGTAAGTPVFQPRQQIINFKYSKPDVDVWAAAASYYNMLTADFPKEIKGNDIWMAMFTGKPVPVRQRNHEIPERLAAVIDKALVEIPDIGIKSARELKLQIVSALPDEIKQAVRGVI